jgi:hypothetical protein
MLNYKDQYGTGIGQESLEWIKEFPYIAGKVYTDPKFVFKNISNAQRYVSKEVIGDNRPIRYLKEGEIHLPNHNFTGPGTRIDDPDVRGFQPYNGVDACSKQHDIEFNDIFKMPLGPERQKKIREADTKVLECYDNHPNDAGYTMAKTGLNSKINLEDISPMIFDKIMGEAYRGVNSGQKGGGDMRYRHPIIYTKPGALSGFSEHKPGKKIYDKILEESIL